MKAIRWMALGVGFASLSGCGAHSGGDEVSSQALAVITAGSIVVNECSSGRSGYIELYNPGLGYVDLALDPDFCWFVDDVEGGGKPKRIADGVVNHEAGSTTCASAGRDPSCGLIGPGERVSIDYSYFNSTTSDECRLVKSTFSAGSCGTTYLDENVGGPINPTTSGQCFGRVPDGAAWSTTTIACTPNAATNGAPACSTQGQSCDDGNPCTSGELIGADCSCGGGTVVADGTACPGGSCVAGACVSTPAPAAVTINEFTPGSSGWIELYNGGGSSVDISGWQIDDVANGGAAPKTISAGTSLAPGAYFTLSYSGFNYASADDVRLLDASGSVVDSHSNFYSGSSINGLCFGRQPDGGDFASSSIPCTKGASNGSPAPSCVVGSACDDNDVCTTGETFQADCSCGGGSATSCDDGNPCTIDSCSPTGGCGSVAASDGTSCGTGLVCQAGQCVTGSANGAVLVSVGTSGNVILRGTIITPDQVIQGEVLLEGDTITCVAQSCDGVAQSGTPSVIETNGIIAPGMIDAHNHILFDIFDESDWSPTKAYSNHNQWPNDAKYGAMVDAKQYLNGEYGSSVNVGCEMDKYGELKGLIAGTTSIVGAANPGNKACYGSLARTIDQSPNDLGQDKIQAATLFPSTSAADSVCNNIQSDKTDAYVIHVGEGVDETARSEFDSLYTVPTNDGCLNVPETTIVHGTAFGFNEFAAMGLSGMSLVWSPRSNVFLYGLGTDYTKTTNIPLALAFGVNVALAPDWSIGGSQNLLDELRFADQVDNAAFGDVLTPQMLVRMVTIQAAHALGLDNVIGSIEVGKKADLFVIGGNVLAPYDSVLAARPKDVRLVMVNGVALYGDPALLPVAPSDPGCETLDVCQFSKFVCVAEPGGTSSNKLGQTLAEIQGILSSELDAYDHLDLSAWDFSPIAPLVKCN